MASDNVHLLVLVHGMWGNPGHLKSLQRLMSEHHAQDDAPAGPAGEKLEILLAETNKDEHTYDGIDWGGERVAEEVLDAVKRFENEGKKVTRFSITGYSLGGLVSRYVVGILHQRKFFETVTPVNFNTFATPHIGLPRYRTFISSLTTYLGPKLLSRTGEQFYTVDKWSARGRPLIEVMADPDRVFYQALCLFEHLRIYANAINDITVPYPTAAIETEDPFFNRATNGIEIEYDEKYSPLIKAWRLPDSPPALPPAPRPLTWEWVKRYQIPLPPALQAKFPYNVLVYTFLPILFPILITLVISRLSFAALASRKRLRVLEKDQSSVDRLVHILGRLERGVEDAVADMIDAPGGTPPMGTPSTDMLTAGASPQIRLESPSPTPDLGSASSSPDLRSVNGRLGATTSRTSSHSSDTEAQEQELHAAEIAAAAEVAHFVLTDLQRRIVRTLNMLPRLQKERAYIEVRNAHGPIICRDMQRFASHKLGEGVIRHWVDHFIM
ncbi:hypothetical protein POSPLADRAFT_1065553 [Postia placenta MAD-698-R-SB12]|uniref:DUF676 domain-containing protein n=1 Tax=Postia placenta MAD-698-R-SB12 TaxID=670580 RepID=A0A1X6N7E0_9APHY|nr:hypothetical protein POSPLADRAFT_1065553 [Postia placenta MAD-698-R-SB12]OSX64323.1 hypothetical protein POSPLADRAFT_1065553 [Postia placenta MAD-698-R-SB12]